MKPKPFSALNHFTVPLAMLLVLRCRREIPGWSVGGVVRRRSRPTSVLPCACHIHPASARSRRAVGRVPSGLLPLGGFLELAARGDLHAVAGRDVDRVAGLRVAGGASGTVGALEGEEARNGDFLVALGDDVADGIGEGCQHGVRVLAGHLGALGEGCDQLTAVHGWYSVTFGLLRPL